MGAAALAEQPQVWEDYRAKFNLGDVAEGTGFGHTDAEADSITAELPLLLDYLTASLQALRTYVAGLKAEDFARSSASSPVTQVPSGPPLLIIIDALQHIAQVQFVGGMSDR